MERVVTSFVGALREKGVRVSPGECLDAVEALAVKGVTGRESVKVLLRLTLVKNAKDIPAFEEVFERFFRIGSAELAAVTGPELMTALIHIVEGELEKRDLADPHDKDAAKLLIDEEVTAEDLEDLIGLTESEDEPDGTEMVVQLDGFRDHKKAASPSEFNMQQAPTVAFHQGLKKSQHLAFSLEELSEMQDVVYRMLVRIRKDVKRMKEKESRGRLHVIRTIQKNYRHDMVPFLLALRRKRKEKPRLVVFCDVSYSVSHATRFMLLLLHTLQNRLMDVRSFIFNREVVEITERLKDMPINTLLETIDEGEIVNLDDNSDYGNVFLTFKQKHLESMRGKPAIIMMGDGRNNYNDANEWALEEIREKAGYLLWLTPEDRETWSRGDCLLELYGQYCDRLEVAKNVEELSAFVEDLFCTLYDHDDTRTWRRTEQAKKEAEVLDYRRYYLGKDAPEQLFDPTPCRRWFGLIKD